MINVKISKRLESITHFVKDNSKIVDIGCDHAFLDIYLYKHRKNIEIIASDINPHALENAKKNIHQYQLDDKIKTRLGSGLAVIDQKEIDTVIMAGMGTFTMLKILNEGIEKVSSLKQIIVQSNTNLELLRKKIIQKGFYIAGEELVKENNLYYVVINFERGKKKYTKKELYFGPILLKENSSLFQEKKQKEWNKLKQIQKKIPRRKIFLKLKTYFIIRLYK